MAGSRPPSPPAFMATTSLGSVRPARRVLIVAARTASSTFAASSASTSPAGVSTTRCPERSNSSTPSRRSSFWIALDSGGCAMPSRHAARPKCNSSATAAK
jgi:hypothetical protein